MLRIFKIAAIILMMLPAVAALAQTPFAGPTDATMAPPTAANLVQKVISDGDKISLSTTAVAGDGYQWFKKDVSGNMQLVQQGVSNTYTETSAGKGYYTYQLVETNANGCTSVVSDSFNIYVLPVLSPAIAATNASVCEQGHTNSVLTATPAADANYTYTYQWARNGVAIPSATSNTYSVTETAAGSVSFTVAVSYMLNPGKSAVATQTINVIPVPTKPSIVAGF